MNWSRWTHVPRFVGVFAAVLTAALMSQTLLAVLQTSPANDRERDAALDLLLAKDEISQHLQLQSLT